MSVLFIILIIVGVSAQSVFKKAYNTIANFAAMEKVAGNWPGKGNDNNLAALYQGLNNALSVKTFAVHGVNLYKSGRSIATMLFAS